MTLLIEPGEQDAPLIRMQGGLRHRKDHFLGIECRASGIDNQTQLRELLKRCQREHACRERSYASLLADHEAEG